MSLEIQLSREGVGIPLTGLPRHIFVSVPSVNVICRGCLQLRREVIVRFVDIGVIVDHHCFKKSLKILKG